MTHLTGLPFTENNLRDMMIESAKAGGIYSPAGEGLPKAPSKSDALTIALTKTAPTRDRVLRIVSKHGNMTSPELAEIMGIGRQHASYHLKNLRASGFVKVTAKTTTIVGKQAMYTYRLKQLGMDLLDALDNGIEGRTL